MRPTPDTSSKWKLNTKRVKLYPNETKSRLQGESSIEVTFGTESAMNTAIIS